jgi:ribokinase
MEAHVTPKRVVVVGPGGKGVSQAIAAARQGVSTALIACVGDDPAGDDLLAALAAEPDLDCAGVARTAGATGTAFVTVDANGDNTVVSGRGADARLDEAHVHRHGGLIGAAVVCCAQLGVPVGAVQAAFEIARSIGTMTVLDPCPSDEVPDDLLRLVDVCTPNETEAERLTGVPVSDADGVRRAAAALLTRGCGAVVVTLGARGAYLASMAGDATFVPAIPVTVVDPTGAGDALCGVLAAGRARGDALLDAVTDAVAAGAVAVTRPGAAAAMPTRAEVVRVRGGRPG